MSFLTSRVSQTLRTPLLRANMAPRVAARTFIATPLRFESHPPILQGEGAKEGEVATEENQSTGLERFEYMGHLQGVDVFDMEPLDASRVGTMKDPIMVRSMYPMRHIGCTGVPADSHETLWMVLTADKRARCPHCGQVYEMEYQGEEGADAHH